MLNDIDKPQPKIEGLTPEEQLLEAAFQGDYERCVTLVEKKQVNVNYIGQRYYLEGWTPIYAATNGCSHIQDQEKYIKILGFLIKKHADPLIKCPSGSSKGLYPIHQASSNHANAIVKLFLDNGVPVDIEDDSQETSLVKAIRYTEAYPEHDHTLSMVNFLVKNGANVNWKDKLGLVSALLTASYIKKADVMLLLLDNHADPNLGRLSVLLDTVTWTPSDLKTKVVKKLLDAGSNYEVKDNYGKTPLDIAIQMRDEQVVQLIKEKMDKPLSSDSTPHNLSPSK